jgi:hypothetical protein
MTVKFWLAQQVSWTNDYLLLSINEPVRPFVCQSSVSRKVCIPPCWSVGHTPTTIQDVCFCYVSPSCFKLDARFQVSTSANIQVEVFWVVTPCSVVAGYQSFRESCCLHFHPATLYGVTARNISTCFKPVFNFYDRQLLWHVCNACSLDKCW